LLLLTIILGIYPYFISSDIEYGLSNLLFSWEGITLGMSVFILIVIFKLLSYIKYDLLYIINK
jgi:hypothetical protein